VRALRRGRGSGAAVFTYEETGVRVEVRFADGDASYAKVRQALRQALGAAAQ
jgi:hypothetical protein